MRIKDIKNIIKENKYEFLIYLYGIIGLTYITIQQL